MSIDALLTRVATALEANTAMMEKLLAASGKTATAPATKAADKPAAKPAAKPAGKPTTKKSNAEPTEASVTERVTTYLKTGDAEERATRKANVKTIIEYFGAERFTTIDAGDWPEALRYLDQYEAGETPEFDGADGEDEGSEDDAMI